MSLNWIFTIWVSVLFMLPYCLQLKMTLAEPCPFDLCKCSGSFIYCDGMGLTEVPPFRDTKDPYEVGWTLYLSDNKIRTIPAGAFRNIHKLRFLAISNNSIDTISDDAFQGIEETLWSLNLEDNLLQDIPVALTKLKILSGISLSNNPLKKMSENVTNNLPSTFQSLSFGGATFDWWPMSIRNIKSLTHLTVTGLNMADLPVDAFVGLENNPFSMIWFQNPGFTTFPNAVRVLHRMTNFMITDANNLNSSGFANVSFEGLASLKSLYIDGSGIDRVPDISNLPQLQDFSFSKAPVKEWSIPNKFPPNIAHITLDLTNFTSIPAAMLLAHNLTSFSFFETPLASIDRKTLSHFPKLDTLALGSSNVSFISDDLFADTKHIKFVDFSHINIKGVPKALADLSELFMLNLDGIPLNCTCKDLGWMKQWPPVKSARVNGMCENLSGWPLEYYMRLNVTHCP